MPGSFNSGNNGRVAVSGLLRPHPDWVVKIEKRLRGRSGVGLWIPLPSSPMIWPKVVNSFNSRPYDHAVVRIEKLDGLEYRLFIRPFIHDSFSDSMVIMSITPEGLLSLFSQQGVKEENGQALMQIDFGKEMIVPEGDAVNQFDADLLCDELINTFTLKNAREFSHGDKALRGRV